MLKFDGNKLKALREERRLTQGQLATLLRKTTSDISNYENGHATPPSDTLLNLMIFFKVSPRGLGRVDESVPERSPVPETGGIQ
jgi:transcriptional regulator with XRE-family HTH domain